MYAFSTPAIYNVGPRTSIGPPIVAFSAVEDGAILGRFAERKAMGPAWNPQQELRNIPVPHGGCAIKIRHPRT